MTDKEIHINLDCFSTVKTKRKAPTPASDIG